MHLSLQLTTPFSVDGHQSSISGLGILSLRLLEIFLYILQWLSGAISLSIVLTMELMDYRAGHMYNKALMQILMTYEPTFQGYGIVLPPLYQSNIQK